MPETKTYNDVAVVGMHYRGAEVKALVSNFVPPLSVFLEPEPENPHDMNALKVMYDETHIGYIERESAFWVSNDLDEGWEIQSCEVVNMEPRGRNIHPIVTIILEIDSDESEIDHEAELELS